MLFNSFDFAVFLPLIFGLYWFVAHRNLRVQNALLLVASYVFYGWWDWRFLSLIAISSFSDYWIGRKLVKTDNRQRRRVLLGLSLLVNLGFLGFFKYYNFFAESFADAFTLFGADFEASRLRIILPVGISFYTFQTLSYTIDIYRKRIEPTRDPLAFFAFVSFFPQLVAGPIERAANLLPQFVRPRNFDYRRATDGMRQILWGLFKKMAIADFCAFYVNDIFANSADHSGSTLLLGAFLFAFQIYGDFSGYSDIAIGTARLFGFNLMRNFAFPYFSRDIAEFWRRWHISLSTWFRDYLYIPLGGSRGGRGMRIRNVFIIFTVSGLWHGANWTFVIWGLIHATLFLPLLLANRNRSNLDTVAGSRWLPKARELAQMGFTFAMTTLAWVFFRAENLAHAGQYLGGIFSLSLFTPPEIRPNALLALISLLVGVEWLQRHKEHGLQLDDGLLPQPLRWAAYYGLVLLILFFRQEEQEFIYFQF